MDADRHDFSKIHADVIVDARTEPEKLSILRRKGHLDHCRRGNRQNAYTCCKDCQIFLYIKEDRMNKEIKEETIKKAERYEEERFNADRALTDLAKDLLSIAGKVEKRMDDLMKDYFPEDVSISMKTQTYRLIGQIRMGHAGEVVINDNPMVRKLSYLIDPNHSLPVISAVIDRENCPGGKYASTYDSVCKTAAQQHTDEGKVGSSDIIEVLDYINDHQTLIECAIKNKDRFLQEYLNEHPGLTMEEEDRNDE